MTDRRYFAGFEIALDPTLPPNMIRIEHANGYDLFKIPAGQLGRLNFVTAKDPATGAWGVVALRGGIEIERWTAEEAIALAANLEAKAKLCFRQGQLPA